MRSPNYLFYKTNMRKTPIYKTLFDFANYYIKGAIIMRNEIKDESNFGLFAPLILNQSFSVELLLKFFILVDFDDLYSFQDIDKKLININSHKYTDLFDKINIKYKTLICDFYNKISNSSIKLDNFKELLIKIGNNPFVEWRYVFEKDEFSKMNLILFNHLTDAFNKAAEYLLKNKL
jgi:hypothetical protein